MPEDRQDRIDPAEHQVFLDCLPELALNILSDAERRVIWEHVRCCPRCIAELASLRRVADGLWELAREVEPPAELNRHPGPFPLWSRRSSIAARCRRRHGGSISAARARDIPGVCGSSRRLLVTKVVLLGVARVAGPLRVLLPSSSQTVMDLQGE